MSLEISSVQFKYHDLEFTLKANQTGSVNINGVPYSIQTKERIDEINSLFQNLDLSSVKSLDDLKAKLKNSGIIVNEKVQSISSILRRRGSMSNMPDIGEITIHDRKLKSKEIEKRDAHLWECVGRDPDIKFKGFLYTYKYRREFLDIKKVHKKNSEIQPAVEVPSDYIGRLNELSDLGYSYNPENQSMVLPDRESLMARWEKLRAENPDKNLPQIDIVDSEGIATDRTFTDAFFVHTAVLSSGKEFVHDHQNHITPILSLILKGDYFLKRQEAAKTVMIYQKRVWVVQRALQEGELKGLSKENLDKLNKYIGVLEQSLGALADVFSADLRTFDVSSYKNFRSLGPIFLQEMKDFVNKIKNAVANTSTILGSNSTIKEILEQNTQKYRNENSPLILCCYSSNIVISTHAKNLLKAFNEFEQNLNQLLEAETTKEGFNKEFENISNLFLDRIHSIPAPEAYNEMFKFSKNLIEHLSNFFQGKTSALPSFQEMWDLVEKAWKLLPPDRIKKTNLPPP